MPRDYIPQKDTEYQAWLGPFTSVMGLNLSTLGLTGGDLSSIMAAKSAFDLSMTDYNMKHDAAEAATAVKDDARTAAEAKSRELAQRIQAKVDVSDGLKASMGLTVHGGPPTPPGPFIPEHLTIEVLGEHLYLLLWDRTGNPPGAMFHVESAIVPTGPWIHLGSTNKIRYETVHYNPDGPTYFHVKAQHGEDVSLPSNMVVI